MNGESPPQFSFFGLRRNSETISENAYSVFLTVTFVIWILFLLLARFRFTIKISDADIYTYAAVAAALGSIALAILTVVHEANAGQRFLKIALGMLTFFFVASCLCSILSATQFTKDEATHPVVTLGLAFALAFVLTASISGRFLRVQAYVFFPFLVPVFPFITVSDHVLPVTALVLLVGGTAGLLVLAFVFLVCISLRPEQPSEPDRLVTLELQRRLEEDAARKRLEQLEKTIIDVLHAHRRRHIATKFFENQSPYSSARQIFLSSEEINEKLRAQKIFVDQRELQYNALSQLEKDQDRVFHEDSNARSGGYYIAPTPSDFSEADKIFNRLSLLSIRYDRNKHRLIYDDLAQYLSAQLHYPAAVVEDRMFPWLVPSLDEAHDYKSTEWPRGGYNSSKGMLYLRLNRGLDQLCAWLRDEVSAHKDQPSLSPAQTEAFAKRLADVAVCPADLKEKLLRNDADGKDLRESLAFLFAAS
jgi:hypothetical protein